MLAQSTTGQPYTPAHINDNHIGSKPLSHVTKIILLKTNFKAGDNIEDFTFVFLKLLNIYERYLK